MSNDREWREAFEVEDPGAAAERTMKKFAQQVEDESLCWVPPPDPRPRRVLHLIVLGNHLDLDLGRWYVPAKPKLDRRDRSLRHHQNLKTQKLLTDARDTLLRGDDPDAVHHDLRRSQKHQAVVMTRSEEELRETLERVYAENDLHPGGIDGGYAYITPRDDWCFEWHEAISCEGGVTDRYDTIAFEHEH